MADIFISYASEDREIARKLAASLEASGWQVWWDRKIITGANFAETIEHELEMASCVIVLWSKNSISSEWVNNEASAAVEKSKLIPALIESVRIPIEFRRKQTADMIGWNGDLTHEGFIALRNGVLSKVQNKNIPEHQIITPQRIRFHWKLNKNFWVVSALICLGFLTFFTYRNFKPEPIIETYVYTIGKDGGTKDTQFSPQLDYEVPNFFSTEILKLKFEGNDAACSDVKLRIFLDGKLIEETDFIIRAKEIDLSPVSSGNHTLKLSPVGRLGGCNTGTLGAWGGKLTLYVSI